jgi:hypothetical protein
MIDDSTILLATDDGGNFTYGTTEEEALRWVGMNEFENTPATVYGPLTDESRQVKIYWTTATGPYGPLYYIRRAIIIMPKKKRLLTLNILNLMIESGGEEPEQRLGRIVDIIASWR